MAQATPIETAEVIGALAMAKQDIAYYESIKLDSQLIEGTRYRIRLNESWTDDD